MTRYHFLIAALVCLAIAIGGTMYRHRAHFDAQACGENTLIHSDGSKTTTPGICNATKRVENDIIHGDYVPASLFDVTVQNSEVYLRKAGARRGRCTGLDTAAKGPTAGGSGVPGAMSLSVVVPIGGALVRFPVVKVDHSVIESWREKLPNIKGIPLVEADGEVWPDPLPGMFLECA